MDQTSSPYFFADLIFGGFGLGIGLIAGWTYSLRLQVSRISQLSAALLAIGLGWVSSTAIASLSHVQLQANSLGIDGLSLRSTSMLFVWPLAVQLLVVFRSPKQSVSTSEPNTASGESE
jgi:disulfide bond formation protein DsbB